MDHPLIQPSELDFLLWDWLRIDRHGIAADLDRATVGAVLDLSLDLAREMFLPHYKDADREEPWQDETGQVHVHPAIGEAIGRYAELGLFGAGFPERLGGMGLPTVVATASLAQFMAANVATAAYVMLTIGNARLIARFGTPEQVTTFALPQIAGRMLGTMALSEPQAGSSLADVRTRAVFDGEDELGRRYRLTGNKMWISGGDHDLTDTIVHLVLAKAAPPDRPLPPGTGGISLFIVPKRLPGGDRPNDVSVAGLNHKMGYRGTANTLLNLGEGRHVPDGGAGAIGWLVGAEGQGLQQMFQMMNEARINVGLGAAALAYRGYRHSLAYARERLQGRRVDAAKDAAPVPIIEHADVKHMLLAQKTYAEGALALVLYCAMLVDQEQDLDRRELLALLTPVAKTWPSEWGLRANDLAIQVHGGYGYTRDFDVEQLYRDNRLNPIHEGTTGVQALDLLGRKLLKGNGRGLAVLRAELDRTIALAREDQSLVPCANDLDRSWTLLVDVLDELRAEADGARRLAGATSFLSAFGHLVVAWIWLDLVVAAQSDSCPEQMRDSKTCCCRYFFAYELPKVSLWLSTTRSERRALIDVPVELL